MGPSLPTILDSDVHPSTVGTPYTVVGPSSEEFGRSVEDGTGPVTPVDSFQYSTLKVISPGRQECGGPTSEVFFGPAPDDSTS